MKRILLFFICFWIQFSFSQTSRIFQNYPSPNASSLGLYGNIPINYFTGIPDINIPLFEINENDMKVPISLNYHTASVKANNHPGWVGLGWNLIAGGAITRIQNGMPDELEADYGTLGYYANYNKLNVDNWSSSTKLKEYAWNFDNVLDNYEVCPDEFYFNFLGYSGKFYLDHLGIWKVSSDQFIRVLFDPINGFLTAGELRTGISNKMPGVSQTYFKRYFNKFTLITPDGFQYEFGGKNATEYSVNYRDRLNAPVVPTTWYLVKITSPHGEQITFDYEPGNLICSLGQSYSSYMYSKSGSEFLETDCSTFKTEYLRSPANGFLIFPVYLKYINSNLYNIVFETSISQELRYDPWDMDYDYIATPNPNPNTMNWYYYFTELSEIQWRKLDRLIIKSKINSFSLPIKKYEFGYANLANPSIDPKTERLKLTTIQEFSLNSDGSENSSHPQFKIFYNQTKLPNYCVDEVDHWGYYNGCGGIPLTGGSFIDRYLTTREPDASPNGIYLKAELIEKINYPTGGYTLFEFEPNTYSQIVLSDRTMLYPFDNPQPTDNKRAGGVRIKKISSYSSESDEPLVKEFFYVINYTNNSNINNLTSSGILGGESKYYWGGYHAKDTNNNLYSYNVFSSGSLLPFGYNTQGSHIGYSEVYEVLKDNNGNSNGYTKFTYTNFNSDIWGISHPDEPAINSIDYELSIYAPYNSKSVERGKLTSMEFFTSANKLVRATKYKYSKTSENFVRAIYNKTIKFCSSSLLFGTAYKFYTYSYNLSQKSEYDYDVNNNSTLKTSNYSYNNYLLINSIEELLGEKILRTTYKYPPEYINQSPSSTESTDIIALRTMISKNMIATPVEVVNFNNEQVIGGKLTLYRNDANGIPFPFTAYNLETNNPLPVSPLIETSTTFTPSSIKYDGYSFYLSKDNFYRMNLIYDKYDGFGNLLQYHKASDIPTSYIWEYNNTLLTAIIKNSTSDRIAFSNFELAPQVLSCSGDFLKGWYASPGYTWIIQNGGKVGMTCLQCYGNQAPLQTVNTLPAGDYVLSYYGKANSTSGGLIEPLTSEIVSYNSTITTDWKYFKTTINLTSASKVILRLTNAIIDDIRLYPLDALVFSTTYNPMGGMTSQTDPNGVTTYYEYDGMGRLWRVKDDHGHVLKRYEYNYGNP